MQDLWRLTAADLAALVKSKKVSAKEAATDALARLDAVNPKINAVVDHRPDDVLKQAAEVDARIARGEDAGILAGVPVTVKVNIDQQGFATTNGLKLQRDAIAPAQLARGRQSAEGRRDHSRPHQLPGLLLSLVHHQSHSRRHQKPARPVDHAGRLVRRRGRGGRGRHRPIAHGTDIAGSIRYPAYACGVHGLRPTLGRVAAFNPGLPERAIGAQIEAVSGPLARTIKDLRLSLAAMSARDPRDPWWVPAPLEGPVDAEARRALSQPGRARSRA